MELNDCEEKQDNSATEATEDIPSGKVATTKPPTEAPTEAPTKAPTTEAPTEAPTEASTRAPTTKAPTKAQTTEAPTTEAPTEAPTKAPETEAPTKQVCPDGWTMNDQTGYCYYVPPVNADWFRGKNICDSYISTVASIHGVQETSTILGL